MLNSEYFFEQLKTETDSCILWPFGCDKDGYGVVLINGQQKKVHRAAYEFHKESITSNDIIRHTCDTPNCFNYKHLAKGSHHDNVKDRVSRGRSAIGFANGRSVLTEDNVITIYKTESSSGILADRFGVDPKTIRDIKKKKIWKYLLEDL